MIENAVQQAKVADLLGARPITQYAVILESGRRPAVLVVDTYNRARFVATGCCMALSPECELAIDLPGSAEDLCHRHGDTCSRSMFAGARVTAARLYAIDGHPPPTGAPLALLTLTLPGVPGVPILVPASQAPKLLIADPRFRATLDVEDWREPPSAAVMGMRNPGEAERAAELAVVRLAAQLGEERAMRQHAVAS